MKKSLSTLACFVIYIFTFLAVAGCSGGGGSSKERQQTPEQPVEQKNVAAKENGATVAASYDEDGANYVIDGDSSESFFWSANIKDDDIVIDFGRASVVSDITIYTDDTSSSSSNPSKIIEVSTDKVNWRETGNTTGVDIPCKSFKIGEGKIFCEFSSAQALRYLRIRITEESDPGSIKIFEVEATGKPFKLPGSGAAKFPGLNKTKFPHRR